MKLKVMLLAAAASFVTCAGYAHAQSTATGVTQSGQLQDVVVTARKRSEKLLNVPISITVLSGKDLQKRAVHSINDLANQTAGFTVDSTLPTSARNDRSFPEFVIRGMLPSISTNPTTTIFLDGAPLIGGEIDDLENLEQVEVLKGPQTAYFGRETFAGAVALTTRDPAQVPTITIDGLVGSRNYYDERGTIEGPIIPGKVSILGSFRYYSRDGSYNNNAASTVTAAGKDFGTPAKSSQKLGDQETKSGNLEIVITPTEDLKIKLLGEYFRDNDGPSAQALILPSQANCQYPATAESGPGNTVPWFCGQAPNRLASQPAANDYNSPAIKALLAYLGSSAAGLPFKPLNKGYGLVREGYHGSATLDDYVPSIGITFSSQTAVDLQRFSELQSFYNDDGSAEPNGSYYGGFGGPTTPFQQSLLDQYNDDPFFVEESYRSLSQELRFTSDSDQRFRYLGGLNYEYTRVDSGLGAESFQVGSSPDTSQTASGFGGIEYDILSNLTISADGRFQTDKESTSPSGGFAEISQSFNNFLPRASLQYKFEPNLMAYFTYSQGINPGTFNGDIENLPPAEKAVLTDDFGAKIVVKPEKLTNYEVGLKGSFFDHTLSLSADAYYDIWYDQIISDSLNFMYQGHLENTAAYVNNGKTDLPGLEGDAEWLPIPQLAINASGAINDTSVAHGDCYTCIEESGSSIVKNKKLPDVSEFQANIGAEWTDNMGFLEGTPLAPLSSWDYFGRGDYTFKSSEYENFDNITYTPPENLLNLRAGVTHGNLTIELFVDNVTNWGGPTSLSGIGDYGNPDDFTYYNPATSNDSLVAGLPDLRTWGVRLHYKFGL